MQFLTKRTLFGGCNCGWNSLEPNQCLLMQVGSVTWRFGSCWYMLVWRICDVGELQKPLAHVWCPKGGSGAAPLVLGAMVKLLVRRVAMPNYAVQCLVCTVCCAARGVCSVLRCTWCAQSPCCVADSVHAVQWCGRRVCTRSRPARRPTLCCWKQMRVQGSWCIADVHDSRSMAESVHGGAEMAGPGLFPQSQTFFPRR